MDWAVEEVHNEFIIFRTFAKGWLETKDVPDNKHYMFILQLSGKDGLCCCKSPPSQSLRIMKRNSQTLHGKPLKAHTDKHLA